MGWSRFDVCVVRDGRKEGWVGGVLDFSIVVRKVKFIGSF